MASASVGPDAGGGDEKSSSMSLGAADGGDSKPTSAILGPAGGAERSIEKSIKDHIGLMDELRKQIHASQKRLACMGENGVAAEILRDHIHGLEGNIAKVEEFLQTSLMQIAPNLTVSVGEIVAARFIGKVGSLTELAKCTIQKVGIMGGSRERSWIFQSPFMKEEVPLQHKKQMARRFTAKLVQVIRVDAFKEPTDVLDTSFAQEMEQELGRILTRLVKEDERRAKKKEEEEERAKTSRLESTTEDETEEPPKQKDYEVAVELIAKDLEGMGMDSARTLGEPWLLVNFHQ